MAKDPAFLFFPGDWLGGTMTMTRHHKGAYMDLLMAQFNCGHMVLQQIEIVLGPDFETLWETILKFKFIPDSDGKFYNEKLEYEINKRHKFTNSRQNNLKSNKSNKSHMDNHMEAHMSNHMENGNGNGNENINKDENEKEIIKTWKNDFDVYLQNCRNGFNDCIHDSEYMKKLTELHPGYDIQKSIEKSFISFWGTKEGWKNKKSRQSIDIDWQSTIMRTLKNSAVYLDKNGKSKATIQQGLASIHDLMEEARMQEAL
jgi:uncharacterized protein YdaU (DUF1376 family)